VSGVRGEGGGRRFGRGEGEVDVDVEMLVLVWLLWCELAEMRLVVRMRSEVRSE